MFSKLITSTLLDGEVLDSSTWIEGVVLRDGNRLFRTALAITGSKAEAEDIVQDAFVRLFEKRPSFTSLEHETAWLIRVTVNLSKNRLRSHWWRKTVPILDTYPASGVEETGLMQTVFSLPAKYRAVIHLFYYEGYSVKEIADITQQRESAIRQQLSRARRMLKDYLEGEY